MRKKILLTILDGYGLRDEKHGNAVSLANNKVFNMLWEKYPHTKLVASGEEVGLPKGQMGNSEVGHMNIGAGRVIYQPLEVINRSILDGSFYNNKEILEVFDHVKVNKSSLHIMGLISDGGVHSHINHLLALLNMCKDKNIKNIYLHLFTDGRDVSIDSSYSYINKVLKKIEEIGLGDIATISGRYFAMDRDNNYDRLKKSYDAIVNGFPKTNESIEEYITNSYKKGITDEFLEPVVFNDEGCLKENDGIVVFNFRKDRLRELLTAITNSEFNEMEVKRFNNIKTVTMYPVTHTVKALSSFKDENLKNTLGEYLESNNLKQLRIAETEKYAHVTFFFDGGREIDYSLEEKILIPSPKVKTYDLLPEMSARKITDILLDKIDEFDVVILNFANGDMLGHTGNLEAATLGVEVVDECLLRLYQKILELDGVMIVTADHGNCEEMLDNNNNIITSHTTNLVPFIVVGKDVKLKEGALSDIAPTIIELLELEKPKEMTGSSLIVK